MFKFTNNFERFGEVVTEKAKNTGRPTGSGNGSIMIDKAAAIRLCKLAGGCAAVLQVENNGGANGYTFKDADGKDYDAKIGYSLRYPNEDGTPIGRGIDMIFIKDQPDYQDPTDKATVKTSLADTCKASSDANVQNNFKSSVLVLNTSPGAPDWCQFTIKKELIGDKLMEEDKITFTSDKSQNFTVPKLSEIRGYSPSDTYKLGDLINKDNNTYICLVSKDPRGASFSGAYGQSPNYDTFAWKQVEVTKKLSQGAQLAAIIKDQTKASIVDTKSKEAEVNEARNKLVAEEMERKKQEDLRRIEEERIANQKAAESSGFGMWIAGILIVLVIAALVYFLVIKKKTKSIENVSELTDSDSSSDNSSSE